MDIADIATPEFHSAAPETPLGSVRSTLGAEASDALLVVDDGECVGVITPDDLLRSQYDDDAQAGQVATPVPHVERDSDVRETARQLVESRARVLPVLRDGELWGSLAQDDLLASVDENFGVLDVGDVQTSDVVAVGRHDSLGEAINRMRENGISRLPVLEDDGRLAGLVTTSDLVEFVVRETNNAGKGDRAGDDHALLDLPVRDVASEPAETTTPETSLDEAVERMLDLGDDGLVVTPEYEELVAGVVTKTDALRSLTYTEEDRLDLQVANADMLRTTTREEVSDQVEEIAAKDQDLDVIHAELRLQSHEEELRGTSLVRCRARLWTDRDAFIATGEGYGPEDALSLALDKLERNVLEQKGRRSDEEYRGQLLRKLDEL